MDDAGKQINKKGSKAGDTLDPGINTSHTQHDILWSEYCPDFGS
jgi:hypothetical protein